MPDTISHDAQWLQDILAKVNKGLADSFTPWHPLGGDDVAHLVHTAGKAEALAARVAKLEAALRECRAYADGAAKASSGPDVLTFHSMMRWINEALESKP